MVSREDVEGFVEDFVTETPNWALFGMAVLLLFFGSLIDNSYFTRHFGGILIAVVLTNTVYSLDVVSTSSSKTFTQVMLILSAAAGLIASSVLRNLLTEFTGTLQVIQVLGLIVIITRVSVHFVELKAGRNVSALFFDGQNDTYGMYTAGVVALLLPEILEWLFVGQYYVWMSWLTLFLACLSFGTIYVYRS
jgi:hypothetical protein